MSPLAAELVRPSMTDDQHTDERSATSGRQDELDGSSLHDIDREVEERLSGSRSIVTAEPEQDEDAQEAVDQATKLRRLVGQVGVRPLSAKVPPARAATPRVDPAPQPATTAPSAEPRWHGPRTELLLAARRARVITVASGKGGVGKTSIAVNLSVALAGRGLRVTLLDADLGTANADLLCGLTPRARLDHALSPTGLGIQDGAARRFADLAIPAPGGFRLVPGSAGVAQMADLNWHQRRLLVQALVELAAGADVLVIDAAAGVGRSVTTLLEAADLGLIMTTPEPTALADAYALMKCLVLGATREPGAAGAAENPGKRLGIVVNQVSDPLEAHSAHARLVRTTERYLGIIPPMVGSVAQDVRVAEAVRAQSPLLVRTPGAQASLNISALGGELIQRLGLTPTASATLPGERGVARLVRRLLGK